MSSLVYHTSRPDAWTLPRPYTDTSMRYMRYGPIQPMERPGWFARLLGLD